MVKPKRKGKTKLESNERGTPSFFRTGLCATLVFVVSVLLYLNTIGHDFVWDDITLIVNDESIRTLDFDTLKSVVARGITDVEGRGVPYYRPLVTLSFHIDYALFQHHPSGFHATNILSNAVTCVFAFLFVYALFANVALALSTALLFALHPIHTEAVAWISGRSEILAALWAFVALTLYVLSRRRSNWFFLYASLTALLFALLSKESAICIPFLILLLETKPFASFLSAHPADETRLVSSRWIRVMLYFGVLGLYLLMRFAAVGTLTSPHEPHQAGVIGHTALPLAIFAGYVGKVLCPLTLNAEYDAGLPDSWLDPEVVTGLVAVLLIIWVAWRFRHRPLIVLGLAVFLLGLGPVLNVIPIGEVSAERFLYFPSFGATLLMGCLVTRALPQGQRVRKSTSRGGRQGSAAVVGIVLLAILIAASLRTVVRNRDWRNEQVLFAKTAEQEPDRARVHANIANTARRQGDLGLAVDAYERALEIDPDYTPALVGLADLYVGGGRQEEAINLLERAVRLIPDHAGVSNNLGLLYYESQRYEEAIRLFEHALTVKPDDPKTHFNLGRSLLQRGSFASARSHLEQSAAGETGLVAADYYLAVLEQRAKNLSRAKAHARRFLSRCAADDPRRRHAEAILHAE